MRVARFFDVTQDDVPGAGTYESPTVFDGGFVESIAHTAGQSAAFASTSRRFGNAAASRTEEGDANKLEKMPLGPGYAEPLPYAGFESMRPEVHEKGRWGRKGARHKRLAEGRGGTFSDLRRRMTPDWDEREGLAAPGSYELGSFFDRAASPSLERSGIGTSSFANSARSQRLLSNAVFVNTEVLGRGSENIGPCSYDVPSGNWRHWRDTALQLAARPHTVSIAPRERTFAEVTLRESGTYVSPRQRLRNLHGSAVAPRAHKGRRPRRIVDVGHSSMRPGASPRRGTFFGLYQQGEASAQKKQRAVDGRRTARVSAQRPAMGTLLWDERERGIRYAYIFEIHAARLLPVSPRCC
jgi:hypothetical protein